MMPILQFKPTIWPSSRLKVVVFFVNKIKTASQTNVGVSLLTTKIKFYECISISSDLICDFTSIILHTIKV